jgi:hypothetical protein
VDLYLAIQASLNDFGDIPETENLAGWDQAHNTSANGIGTYPRQKTPSTDNFSAKNNQSIDL